MGLFPRAGVWLVVASLTATAAVWGPNDAAAADWLSIRRGGVGAVLQAANAAQTTETWSATYVAKVPKKSPLRGTSVRITWRRGPRKKGVPTSIEAVVVATGSRRDRVGLAITADGKLWLKAGRGKAAPATAAALSRPIRGLNAPVIVFAMLAMVPSFNVKLEGEFGGTAVMRLLPRYSGLSGLSTCKIGVSKKTRFADMAEFGVGDGKNDVKVAWIGVRLIRGQLVPDGLRVLRDNGKTHVDFERAQLTLGSAAKALKFGPDAL